MLRTAGLFISAAFFAVILVSAVLAYDVPDKILIERPKGNQALNSWVKRVEFLHGEHAIKVPCRDCHHKETGKDLGGFVPCRSCHTDDDPTNQAGFYRAWHADGPPSCLGCHTQMRARGGANPVGCTTACHKPE